MGLSDAALEIILSSQAGECNSLGLGQGDSNSKETFQETGDQAALQQKN